MIRAITKAVRTILGCTAGMITWWVCMGHLCCFIFTYYHPRTQRTSPAINECKQTHNETPQQKTKTQTPLMSKLERLRYGRWILVTLSTCVTVKETIKPRTYSVPGTALTPWYLVWHKALSILQCMNRNEKMNAIRVDIRTRMMSMILLCCCCWLWLEEKADGLCLHRIASYIIRARIALAWQH